MAAKVNTRFVVMLAVVLIVLAGVVGFIGYTTILRSGDRLVRLGDEAMAAGKADEAADFYSRAVNKDQGNVEWLNKWISAIEKVTPRNKQGYTDRYFNQYIPALTQIARVQRRDVGVQKRVLGEAFERLTRYGGNLAAWEQFHTQVGDTLRFFEQDPQGRDQLRRFRGIAQVALIGISQQVPEENIKKAEEDLSAALAVDPADEDVAASLSDLYRSRAVVARQNRDDAAADEWMSKARAVLTAFIAANPPAARSKSELLRMDMGEQVRLARDGKAGKSLIEVIAALTPQMEEVRDAFLATPPEKLSPIAVERAARLIAVSRVEGLGVEGARKIMEHGLKGRPDDPMLSLQYAKLLQTNDRHDEALAQFQRVVAMKDRPVSLAGLVLYDLRTEAVAAQVDSVLAAWRPNLSREEQDAILAKVKALRADAGDRLGGSSPALTLIDGKLEYAQNNLSSARSLITQYLTDTGNNDPVALLLLSRVLNRQGNTGAAKVQLERMLTLEPTNTAARMELARLNIASGNAEAAAANIKEVVTIDPTNQEAVTQLEALNAAIPGRESKDPVVVAITEAMDKVKVEIGKGSAERDIPGAIAVLQQAIEKNGHDVRLCVAMAQLQNASGDKDGALATVTKGLEQNPGNVVLVNLKNSFEVTDPCEAHLAKIEQLEHPAWQKHLLRFDAYRMPMCNKPELAAKELAAAVALAPDEAMVIEYQFQDAIARKDLAAARALADRAAQKNVDTVQGNYFRGRLLLEEGKPSEAAAALQQSVELDKNNPQAWRYLGDARLFLKQYDSAVTSYARSLEIRPGQAHAIAGMMEAHTRAGRLDDALAVARTNKEIAQADPRVREAWLILEADAPSGNKDFALAGRQQVLKIAPGNDSNRIALAGLLMNRQRWDEARTVIDELLTRGAKVIAQGDPLGLQLVQLDAQWNAAQGKLKEAWDVWQNYIAALPADKRDGRAEVSLARLLMSFNQPIAAVEALEKGREYQDKKTLPIDRELGDLHFRMGDEENLKKSLEYYKRVLKDGEDDGNIILRAVLETMLILGQTKEVDEMIKSAGAKAENDAGVVIIQAQAAAAAGDRAKAKQLHDRAVAMDPNNPVVYDARAIFNSTDRAMAPDIEEDLKRALQLSPRYTNARLRLASLYANTGRWDDSLLQLNQAVEFEPNNTDLRVKLIRTLIERQQGAAAVEQLDAALAREPENIQWLVSAAQIFGALGTPERAIPYIEKAWTKMKVPEIAKIYVQVLLRSRQPNLAKAIEILNTPEIKTEENVELLGQRAVIHTLAGRRQQADRDLGVAFRLTNQDDNAAVQKFFTALSSALPDFKDRLRFLESVKPAEGFKGWMAMILASMKMRVPELRDQGLAELQALSSEGSAPAIRTGAYRLLGTLAYDEKRYEEAVDFFTKALELTGNRDPELMNNIAYALGIDLKRPKDAMPYATGAYRLRPREAKFLDTLAALHLALGELDRAGELLQRAQDNITSDDEKPPIYIHTAQLALARKNREEAQRYHDRLQSLLGANERLGRMYADDLKALSEELAR